jgi:predicted nucleotidyltransferase
MDRAVLESEIVRVVADRSDLAAVYLFGSRARGDAGEKSDVDLAVLFPRLPGDPYAATGVAIAAVLESALRLPVDVIVLNSSPPALVHRVLRDGRVLIDRDPVARIAFEVDARNRYFDLQPIVRAYRSARS